jgi:general secretion pathway protein G
MSATQDLGVRRGPEKRCQARDGESGYTLTELLVVLLVLGLLAAAITPVTIDQMNRAKARTARLQMETIAAAVALYAADVGRPPTAEEGLAALLTAPNSAQGWGGPYLRSADRLVDPWSRPYLYTTRPEESSFVVQSLGADGKPAGVGANADLAIS